MSSIVPDRAFVVCCLLAFCVPAVIAANPPISQDYLIVPTMLPPYPSDGRLHELKLDPEAVSSNPSGTMQVTEFDYDFDPLHKRAIAIQILDSRTYATVNRMQMAGQMGPTRARCYQAVEIHPANEPQQKIDGFLGKAIVGCDTDLFLVVPTGGHDRFLIHIIDLNGGHIEPEQARAWLLDAAPTLDFRKLQKVPAIE